VKSEEVLGEEAEELDVVPAPGAGEAQLGCEALDGSGERVLSDDFQVKVHSPIAETGGGAEEGVLVLHAVEAAHVEESGGRARSARAGCERGPAVEGDALRQALGANTQRSGLADDEVAGRGNARGARERDARPGAAPPVKAGSITDLGDGGEVAAGEVEEDGEAESAPRRRRDHPARRRPEGVEQVERGAAVLGADLPEHSQTPGCAPRVVNRRSQQRPLARLRLLCVGEDVDVVIHRHESLDEPEEYGDYSFAPAAIHAAGDEHRDLHRDSRSLR
jgi:hypothetical protein